MADTLRKIPSVDVVLQSEAIKNVALTFGRPVVTDWVRRAVASVRVELLRGARLDPDSLIDTVIQRVDTFRQQESFQSLGGVINATGIVLHTNLGRAPLAASAVQRIQECSKYTNVELDLQQGRRAVRGARAARLLAELSGAEDALIVNNCASATMLVLNAVAGGGSVVVSRGQLVEIGGGFRLPEVFEAAGVRLCEVGTTNRTYVRDYQNAIDDETRAVIRVHRSNFSQTGFVTEPSIEDLVTLQRSDGVAIIDDLGSGCINSLADMGIDEPTVIESVRSGADLTLFSGDKLFGGPQAGIIVGNKRWIQKVRISPMMRAMRADKLTLAAIEATTEIHLRGKARSEIPTLQMIGETPESVRERCDYVQSRLGMRTGIEIVASDAAVGGGSAAGVVIPSFALRCAVNNVERLAALLRTGQSAVQGRVSADCVLLDMRTVDDSQLDDLVFALKAALEILDAET